MTAIKLTVNRDFMPDWSEDVSADEAREVLGLEITGEGWYLVGEDTALVTALPQVLEPPVRFRLHVWNSRNPAEVFGWVAHAPTRLDARVTDDVWPPEAKAPRHMIREHECFGCRKKIRGNSIGRHEKVCPEAKLVLDRVLDNLRGCLDADSDMDRILGLVQGRLRTKL